MNGFILVYVTNPSAKEARKIGERLLEKRIIACFNIFPIESAYWWKGKIEKEKEVVLLTKTRKESWEKLKKEIKKVHPYDVPCIIKIEVKANEEYEDWIHSETSQS